jgi:hypothetical protein
MDKQIARIRIAGFIGAEHGDPAAARLVMWHQSSQAKSRHPWRSYAPSTIKMYVFCNKK